MSAIGNICRGIAQGLSAVWNGVCSFATRMFSCFSRSAYRGEEGSTLLNGRATNDPAALMGDSVAKALSASRAALAGDFRAADALMASAERSSHQATAASKRKLEDEQSKFNEASGKIEQVGQSMMDAIDAATAVPGEDEKVEKLLREIAESITPKLPQVPGSKKTN
jgi:hypothetical protein